MIVREVLKQMPTTAQLFVRFDFFNDYKDTMSFLKAMQRRGVDAAWRKGDKPTDEEREKGAYARVMLGRLEAAYIITESTRFARQRAERDVKEGLTIRTLARMLHEEFEDEQWGDIDPWTFAQVADNTTDLDDDGRSMIEVLERVVTRLKNMNTCANEEAQT